MASKMYILVKQSLPSHKSVAIAHGVLMCYLKYKDTAEMSNWLEHSFRKVVCEVSDEQFEVAKSHRDFVVVTESGLGGIEVALAFPPKESWPHFFQKLPLAAW